MTNFEKLKAMSIEDFVNYVDCCAINEITDAMCRENGKLNTENDKTGCFLCKMAWLEKESENE